MKLAKYLPPEEISQVLACDLIDSRTRHRRRTSFMVNEEYRVHIDLSLETTADSDGGVMVSAEVTHIWQSAEDA